MAANQTSTQQLAALCQKLLQNPITLHKVSDRVYELLQEDIRNQRDRAGHYGGRL